MLDLSVSCCLDSAAEKIIMLLKIDCRLRWGPQCVETTETLAQIVRACQIILPLQQGSGTNQ